MIVSSKIYRTHVIAAMKLLISCAVSSKRPANDDYASFLFLPTLIHCRLYFYFFRLLFIVGSFLFFPVHVITCNSSHASKYVSFRYSISFGLFFLFFLSLSSTITFFCSCNMIFFLPLCTTKHPLLLKINDCDDQRLRNFGSSILRPFTKILLPF